MKPTKTIIALLEAALMIEAYRDTIKPKVEAIYNETMDFMIPPKYLVDKRTGEKITHYNKLYRVEDNEHIPAFYAGVNKILIEKGFKPEKPGCCHLLETECALRDANRAYLKECCKVLPQRVLGSFSPEEFFEKLCTGSLEHYKSALEINRSYHCQFVNKKRLLEKFEAVNI